MGVSEPGAITIYIDLTTSSDELNAFEKNFIYFVEQKEMNILLGQWKEGIILQLRTNKRPEYVM